MSIIPESTHFKEFYCPICQKNHTVPEDWDESACPAQDKHPKDAPEIKDINPDSHIVNWAKWQNKSAKKYGQSKDN